MGVRYFGALMSSDWTDRAIRISEHDPGAREIVRGPPAAIHAADPGAAYRSDERRRQADYMDARRKRSISPPCAAGGI